MTSLLQTRQPLVGIALAAVAGISFANWRRCDFTLLVILAALLILLLWWRRTALVLAFTAVVFALLHTLNWQFRNEAGLRNVLGLEPRQVEGVAVVTSEPEEQPARRNLKQSLFEARLQTLRVDAQEYPSNEKVLVRWSGNPPAYGDRVSFAGDGFIIGSPRNPHQFDYAAYMQRRGIDAQIRLRYPSDGKVLEGHCGNWLVAGSLNARHWMQQRLTYGMEGSPEIAGLMQGLVLGVKTETPEDIRQLFQQTGTYHILVVSGLHVAILAALCAVTLKPLLDRRRAVVLTIPVIIFYAYMTGLGAGTVRAAIMTIFVLIAFALDRQPRVLNSVAAAALLILAGDTNQLFMPGFQFSFLVVIAIVLLAGRIQESLASLGRIDPFIPRPLWTRWQSLRHASWLRFSSVLALSLASWVGMLPATLRYFHMLSPSALLANLLVVPLSFICLGEGLLTIAASTFSSGIASLFGNASWFCCKIILGIVQLSAAIPGSYTYVESPQLNKAPLLEVTVLDLGEGASVHLRSGSHDWLIDCGNDAAFRYIVAPYLRARGIDQLDGLMLTHGDASHLGAATEVWRHFKPKQIILSQVEDRSKKRREFLRLLPSGWKGKHAAAPGDTFTLSPETTFRILAPDPKSSVRLADDKAMVVQVECAGRRFLLMSDSGYINEQWLLNQCADLCSDVLIKGRHTRDHSGTADFLSAVDPEVLICNAATFPPEVRLDENWAADVVGKGISLFRQDQTGAVTISVFRRHLQISSFLTDQTLRSSKR